MTLIVILVVYAGLMVGLGAYFSRRVRASSDFFVAGRGLGAGLIFSTLLAANIGAGSTVGAAGLGYRDGLSSWWWVGSAGLGSLVLAFTVGPRIWKVASENNLFTVGDYLEFRFSRSVRGLAAMLLSIGSLSILAGQLIAVAWILNVVAGVSKPVGCLIAAVVITAYFTLGGLHASARVNVLQLAVKLLGFGVALAYLLSANGGIGGLRHLIGQAGGPAQQQYWDLTGSGATGVVRYLVILAPAFVVSPGLLQKVFGARDQRAVRVGVGWNAAGLLIYAIVPVLIGMIARAHFPDLANQELALPALLTQALPFWLGALLLAAVFSAELSAADAVLFMLSTTLSKDIYKGFINSKTDDNALVRVARASAICCGAVGAVLAIVLPTVISALTVFYTLLTAGFLLPIIAGLYSKRVNAAAATAAMVVSVTATIVVHIASAGQGVWGIPVLVVGVSAGAIAMLVAAALDRSGSGERAR